MRQPSPQARDADSSLFISALSPQRAMADHEVDFDEDFYSSEVWKDILEHWKLLIFPL